MSYSASDSSMDSVAQWIDTSLISDPDLLHLMELHNPLPFNSFNLESSTSIAEDTFAIITNQTPTNDFELTNGVSNRHMPNRVERKPSVVKSDAMFASFSILEQQQTQERPVLDEFAKLRKERRRAQNRKAQQAFRQRKDTAIARLEREMEKLRSINHDLTETNRLRLQEVSELKARLEALRLSPVIHSVKVQTAEEEKTGLSTSSCGSTSAGEQMTTGTEPWLTWRGRLYFDKEALENLGTENGGSSVVRSPTGLVDAGAHDF